MQSAVRLRCKTILTGGNFIGIIRQGELCYRLKQRTVAELLSFAGDDDFAC